MCGIVGYVGANQAAPIVLEGLERLEYRGYDSAGVSIREGEKNAKIVRAKGRLKFLEEKTNNGASLPGNCGIGHTRWATHGEASEINAHPHHSDDNNVIGVHNGIIENYQELREKLIKNGYSFYSQTDTEVAVKLVDYYYKKYKLGPVDAIAKTMVRVRGSYALCIMFKDHPDEIWVARKDSPMIIGSTDSGSYVASDVAAMIKYCNNVCYIGNLEMACLKKDSVTFYDLNGDVVNKEFAEIELDASSVDKGGFEHFMMKEIHEQPKAVEDTYRSLLGEDKKSFDFTKSGISNEELSAVKQVTIVACGSAWHVGRVAEYVIESLAKIPVRVELASEFRYRNPLLSKDTLVVAISQSGETADTLEAVKEANRQGVKTLAVVNVVESSIAREANHVLYTLAGPEISVATTKAYSTQLIVLYALAMELAKCNETVDAETYKELIEELATLPNKIEKIIDDKERIQWFAAKYSNAHDIFFIGRGIDYSICMEGSLKLKEISYIHSEAYAAGELKHGTISLIEDGTLVIGVLSQKDLFEKTISNMIECKTRGAYLMGLTNYGNYEVEDAVDFAVYIPKTVEYFAASLAVVPLQLLGYYVAVAKGLDVDKPRNLAKSVTVE